MIYLIGTIAILANIFFYIFLKFSLWILFFNILIFFIFIILIKSHKEYQNLESKKKLIKNYKTELGKNDLESAILIGNSIIESVYNNGFIEATSQGIVSDKNSIITLKVDNQVQDIIYNNLLSSKDVFELIKKSLGEQPYNYSQNINLSILSEIIKPNVSYDNEFTQKVIEESINEISLSRGKVSYGELIILKGDIVEGKKMDILYSLKGQSESKLWTNANYYWIVLGYTILVSLALLMLLLFLHKYRKEIFDNNTKVTFIFFKNFFFD